MTALYRMLLLVITRKLDELKSELLTQIRSFRPDVPESEKNKYQIDLEVAGFWNFMLEVVFNFYIIICYAISIALIAVLAIVCYPFNAILSIMASLLRGSTAYSHTLVEEPVLDKITSDLVIVKKPNGKEKI